VNTLEDSATHDHAAPATHPENSEKATWP